MPEKIIYFNRTKAFLHLLAGLSIWASLFFPFTKFLILKCILFFIGGSFIYFAFKSISGKPQVIIAEDSLFIALRFNKKIPWKNIKSVAIKHKTVDYRSMRFLQLTLNVPTSGPSKVLVRDFPLENLDTPAEEIIRLIEEKKSNLQNQVVA